VAELRFTYPYFASGFRTGLRLLLVASLAAVALLAVGQHPATAAGLSVSQRDGLDPAGQSVQVSGSGYDESKGIYVAFCVTPSPGQVPTPCSGGAGGGGSAWISSNPPPYAGGAATPYGPGGSFSVSVYVSGSIGGYDCTQVSCAVVTRNDHTLPGDRSQDVIVPVSFAVPEPPPAPAGPSGPSGAPAPSDPGPAGGGSVGGPGSVGPGGSTDAGAEAAAGPVVLPPPIVTVDPDGRSAGDGTRALRVAKTTGLRDRAVVEVSGTGFDPAKPVVLALCRVGTDGAAPGPCAAPDRIVQPANFVRIAADPVADVAADARASTTYDAGGAFTVQLRVPAEIDATTDCRDVACAVTTRPDETAPDDRSQEIAVPVRFAAAAVVAESAGTREGTVRIGGDDGDAGTSPWLVVIPIVLVVLVAAGVVVYRRARRPSVN